MDERYDGGTKRRNVPHLPNFPSMNDEDEWDDENDNQNQGFSNYNGDTQYGSPRNSIDDDVNNNRNSFRQRPSRSGFNYDQNNDQNWGDRSSSSSSSSRNNRNWNQSRLQNQNDWRSNQNRRSSSMNSSQYVQSSSVIPELTIKPNQNHQSSRRNVHSTSSRHIYIVMILLLFILGFQGYIIYNFHKSGQFYCFGGVSSVTGFMLPAPPDDKTNQKSSQSFHRPESSTKSGTQYSSSSYSNRKSHREGHKLPKNEPKMCPHAHRSVGGDCTSHEQCCTNFCHPLQLKCKIRRSLGEKCDFLDCQDSMICRGKPTETMVRSQQRDRVTKKFLGLDNRKCIVYGKVPDGYECMYNRECRTRGCNHKKGICESTSTKPSKPNPSTTTTSKKSKITKTEKKNTNTKNVKDVKSSPTSKIVKSSKSEKNEPKKDEKKKIKKNENESVNEEKSNKEKIKEPKKSEDGLKEVKSSDKQQEMKNVESKSDEPKKDQKFTKKKEDEEQDLIW